jgi:predicted HTH domain antitoxin
MGSRTIRVDLQVPDRIPDTVRASVQSRAEETVVLGLWEAGELSTRRAAEELGLSYREFLDLLAVRGIPVESGLLNIHAIQDTEAKLSGDRT